MQRQFNLTLESVQHKQAFVSFIRESESTNGISDV